MFCLICCGEIHVSLAYYDYRVIIVKSPQYRDNVISTPNCPGKRPMKMNSTNRLYENYDRVRDKTFVSMGKHKQLH